MIQKTFSLTLDTKRGVIESPIIVVKGDTGNVFHITVQDNGTNLDLTGTTVVVAFRGASGSYTQDMDTGEVTVSGAVVSFPLYSGAVSEGTNSCDIQIYSGNNSDTLTTTAAFTFECRAATVGDDTVKADATLPIILSLLHRLQEACDSFPEITCEEIDGGHRVKVTSWDETVTLCDIMDGKSGVFVGSGDMPEGYNVQIDPDGTLPPMIIEDVDGGGTVGKVRAEYGNGGREWRTPKMSDIEDLVQVRSSNTTYVGDSSYYKGGLFADHFEYIYPATLPRKNIRSNISGTSLYSNSSSFYLNLPAPVHTASMYLSMLSNFDPVFMHWMDFDKDGGGSFAHTNDDGSKYACRLRYKVCTEKQYAADQAGNIEARLLIIGNRPSVPSGSGLSSSAKGNAIAASALSFATKAAEYYAEHGESCFVYDVNATQNVSYTLTDAHKKGKMQCDTLVFSAVTWEDYEHSLYAGHVGVDANYITTWSAIESSADRTDFTDSYAPLGRPLNSDSNQAFYFWNEGTVFADEQYVKNGDIILFRYKTHLDAPTFDAVGHVGVIAIIGGVKYVVHCSTPSLTNGLVVEKIKLDDYIERAKKKGRPYEHYFGRVY